MVLRDKWTLNTIATFNGKYPPEEVALKSFQVEKLYKDVLNAPENNNNGYTTCRDLEDLGSNLYHSYGKIQGKPKRGFTTTMQTRPEATNQLAEEIRLHSMELRDPDLIKQCRTFVHNENNGRPEADGIFLDDLVIACSICSQVIKEKPFKPKANDKKKQVASYRRTVKNAGFKFGG
jgi:hypothetical protein